MWTAQMPNRVPDPLQYAEAAAVPVLVESIVIPNRKRPGAHQAHVAPEHIEELRQLINARLSQELSDGGNPRVILDLENRSTHLVQMLQSGFSFLHQKPSSGICKAEVFVCLDLCGPGQRRQGLET